MLPYTAFTHLSNSVRIIIRNEHLIIRAFFSLVGYFTHHFMMSIVWLFLVVIVFLRTPI